MLFWLNEYSKKNVICDLKVSGITIKPRDVQATTLEIS